MEEVFTCGECGHQHWIIFGTTVIACAKCRMRYNIGLGADQFNADRDRYDRRPKNTFQPEPPDNQSSGGAVSE